MKANKFLKIIIIFLIVMTLVLTFSPVISIAIRESDLGKKAEVTGDTYYYCFSTAESGYWNNTSAYVHFLHSKAHRDHIYVTNNAVSESGILILHIKGNSARFTVVTKICNYSGGKTIDIVHRNFQSNLSSRFLSNFINTNSVSGGSYGRIDGEYGIVQGSYRADWGYFKDTNPPDKSNLSKYLGATYDTAPFIVHFPYFNKTLPDTSSPFDEFNAYDRVGSKNVLVRSDLGGNSGFLRQLLFNQTIMHNGTAVIPQGAGQFNMLLVATNVALGPVPLLHYMKEYLPLELILWIAVLPSSYFIVIRKTKIIINDKR